jgi:hypothetical protein
MKVAVLLTGQLRTFEMLKDLHMNALIKQYNADVFLGIDVNNTLQVAYKNSTAPTCQELVSNAIAFYNPIDTFILDTFSIEGVTYNNSRRFRQYYVVKNMYKMLKTHMDNHNIKYDLIIRLRFDQYIFSKEVPLEPTVWNKELQSVLYNQTNIDILKKSSLDKKFIFEEINDNNLYVLGFGDYKHYKYANDQFFYHNHSLLDKMFEFYDNMLDTMNYCIKNNIGNKGCMTECIFYTYVTNNNINFKCSNIKGIFIREFL